MSTNPIPVVAIVGRPNVGKSCLFNRLVGRRIAIVHDQPGVTRDRLAAPCKYTSKACTLIDTGGIGADLDDGFTSQVTTEADIAMQTADVILMVVDARDHVTPIDAGIAAQLNKKRNNIPIILVLNKSDSAKQELGAGEFSRLGFGSGISVSAEHGRGIDQLIKAIDRVLPDNAPLQEPLVQDSRKNKKTKEATPEQEDIDNEDEDLEIGDEKPLRIAIVGRPNAGKSSLINAILNDKRAIVSSEAGTTRDAIDVPYSYNEREYILIDTAGIRPRSRRDSSVEVFSVMRSEKAIRRCDICLLVIDIAAGVTAQDRRIAGMIADEGKPCIIVANKFDLFHPSAPRKPRLDELKDILRSELFFLDYAPFLATSALQQDGVHVIFSKINNIEKSASSVIGTGRLNRILQNAMINNPPPTSRKYGKRVKLYYATTAVNDRYLRIPVPTYILFVNDKRLMSESYEQYLSNRLREEHPNPGVPIRFSIRSREQKPKPNK